MAKKENKVYGFKIYVRNIGGMFEIITHSVDDFDTPAKSRIISFDKVNKENFINCVLENTTCRINEQKNPNDLVKLLKKLGHGTCMNVSYDFDGELWVEVDLEDKKLEVEINEDEEIEFVPENEMASAFEKCCNELYKRSIWQIVDAIKDKRQAIKEDQKYIEECEAVFEL